MGEYAKARRANVIAPPEPKIFPVHAGKRFLVSGATGGIGAAVAGLLLRQGASVALADLDEDATRALADHLDGSAGGVHPVQLDLTDPKSIAAAAERAVALLGGLDGLANVAGIVRMASAVDHTRDLWADQLEINVMGPFELARRVAAHLIEEGRPGMIVNVSSDAGKQGHAEMVGYNASKAAVINWTRGAAKEWSQYSINVNCVCPSAVDTPMLRQVALDHERGTSDDLETIFGVMAPEQLGRLVTAAEVASVISFLLQDSVQAVRGQSINVDGGNCPY
jgi:NAD(P)-dependent dehydrogenase (short-subunit alcohol dehydrogenase family)